MNTYRVLVVTNLWPSEADPGFGSFVRAQMESLRPLGVEYDVVFINGRASRWNYLHGVGEMRRRLRAARYDLIHAHFGLAGWVARCQVGVPVVVSFMGDDVLGQYRRDGRVSLWGQLFRVSSFLLARRVAAVIVKTRQMQSRLRLPSARVIPNGVDLELFRPMDRAEARRSLGLDREKQWVLFPYDPGIENKRFDLVQAAVSLAQRELPQLEILQISRAPRERVPVYMNAADVLVLASHSEGSPNAVKEAMAVNLPVVTVKVGDAAELIAGTEGCHLVEREAGALAERIVEVCRRGERTRGRPRMERLSMASVARQVVEVYARALRGAERAAGSRA
jgi:glycosyltransferase involved in cell wall biosynthesis